MVAQVEARSLIILINGNDWSKNLVSFEIGFESYNQGTGLILKKGSLVLCNTIEDLSPLDPIDQSDFNVGNIVQITIDGFGSHPLGGELKILTVPEVSAIENSLPMVEGNLVVSIPVGCNLAFYRREEPDDDATNVSLGTPRSLSSVVRDCLTKAELPLAKINTSNLTNTLTATMPFAFSKNGSGFIDFAGELAYSGRVTSTISPCVLFCDTSNVAKVKRVISPKTDTFTGVLVTIGTSDRGYERQLDLSIAPGIVEMSGLRRVVKNLTDDYPYTDTTVTGSESESVTYYKGNAYVGFLPTNSIKKPSVLFDGDPFPPFPFAGFPAITQGDLTFVRRSGETSSEEWIGVFTDKDGYIVYEFQIRYVEAEILYPGGWQSSSSAADAILRANTLTISEAVVTTFSLSTKGQVLKKTTINYLNLFKAQPSAVFAYDFSVGFPNTFPMRAVVMSKKTVETWTEINQNKSDLVKRYAYKVSEFSPRIINNPTYESDQEFPSLDAERADRWKQEVRVTIVNKRDTTPPQAQQWTGIYQVEEEQITGKKVFGTGLNVKPYRLQSPFWFSSAQPDIFAEIEGEVINGRQYQYLIQCDPSLFLSVTEPLKGVTVLEPLQKRYFLADALTWYHTATETYVAFAGIYAGSSAVEDTSPTFFTSQLTVAAIPTATITIGGFIVQDFVSGSAEANV